MNCARFLRLSALVVAAAFAQPAAAGLFELVSWKRMLARVTP